MDITQTLNTSNKLSLMLPERSSLDSKFCSKDYSNITLLCDNNVIKVIENLHLNGTYGSVYDGIINGKNCIVKISHDNLHNYDFNTYDKCLLYENEFLNLSMLLMKHKIIPHIFLFKCLSNFDYLVFKKKQYDNDKFNNSINTQYNEYVYVLCTEKYDCDLFKLYENNILEKNKNIIELKLLELFIKLGNIKYIYTDMKMENVVVRLDKYENVIDVKIIDMDPIFCLSFSDFFQKKTELIYDNVINNVVLLYKYIFYKRSNHVLFDNIDDFANIYNDVFSKVKLNSTNKNAIYNMHNLIFI
jgi:hypothetical protein